MTTNRRGFIAGAGTLLSVGALSRQARANALVVKYDVAPINQGNANLCWAAATAMLLNWPLPGIHTMQSVANLGGPQYVALYNTKAEITALLEERLYQKLNLKVESGFSPTINGWYNLLKNKGPLHVTVLPNGSRGMLHGLLITGLVGDGSPLNTTIYYNDPATGTKETAAVTDFVKLYDGAANWTNNIIHHP